MKEYMFTYKKHEFYFASETVEDNRDGKPYKFHKAAKELVTCYIYDDCGRLVAAGTAWCHEADDFLLLRGMKIALQRALLGFHLTKKQRVAVWKKYLKMIKKESVI